MTHTNANHEQIYRAELDYPTSGSCGGDAGWSVSGDGTVLTIRGSGPMQDYRSAKEPPWRRAAGTITTLVVEGGITTLGDYAFQDLKQLTHVDLPETLTRLGCYAFGGCVGLERIAVPEGVRILAAKAFSGCAGLASIDLPASLEAVDMKAFHYDPALRTANYAGTKDQWAQIRVSNSAKGNQNLLDALVCTGQAQTAEKGAAAPADRRGTVIARVKAALASGGDGNIYILAPDLRVPDITAKTGDCTLVVFPRGAAMLIDAGLADSGAHVLGMLRELELTHLDYFLLTHPHTDHAGNALAVGAYVYGAGGTVDHYLYSGYRFGKDTETRIWDFYKGKDTRIDRNFTAGKTLSIDGVSLEVFGPSQEEAASESTDDAFVNNVSILLKLTYGGSTYLTGGDLYISQELKLVQRWGPRLQADVAKCNHHGLYTSNSREWLDAVRPKILLAENDDVGSSVLAEAVSRDLGAAYYSTGVDGDVLIVMDNNGNYQVMTQYHSNLRRDDPGGHGNEEKEAWSDLRTHMM